MSICCFLGRWHLVVEIELSTAACDCCPRYRRQALASHTPHTANDRGHVTVATKKQCARTYFRDAGRGLTIPASLSSLPIRDGTPAYAPCCARAPARCTPCPELLIARLSEGIARRVLRVWQRSSTPSASPLQRTREGVRRVGVRGRGKERGSETRRGRACQRGRSETIQRPL